ncbi:NAD(P)H-hydrate dehydratase [Streptococcus panodentis]|uniref:ADP-dependent (S)-NAD(P)H-hydrate dehydratase n=1 Tax=Streptococcus panodentis TaxID=1581472 RepID=A0ABS5AXP9_9STRE|nr:NAD(P)H-hydrate dehydratase [Streptococcus panodentis]MBP2621305.1 NAD(P)H-hydrate dehydratase [Streptococcus panodentis]
MKQIGQELLQKVITSRPLNSHKGDYGRLLLIGGTYPYGGAIIMAALAAVRSGAGLVTAATDRENIAALHSRLPEAMAFDLRETDRLFEQMARADVVLIGPGLAEGDFEKALLSKLLQEAGEDQVLIVDGGAISLFSQAALSFLKAQAIFTPHQKEWERLSGLPVAEQTEAANRAAVNAFPLGTILVQKKHGTAIYQSGSSESWQLTAGGPYQATGGMGDTLAGMIAAFAGQFKEQSLLDRVAAATLLHSVIADALSREAYVVLPTDISREIPRWMKLLCEEKTDFS